MSDDNTDEDIWIALAELFFLDTEPDDFDFQRVAELLKTNKWTKEKTFEVLYKLISPHAGANLGYLILLTIGEWSGFDKKNLSLKIKKSQILRQKMPNYLFMVSDWWCKRMLKELKVDKLLNQI